MTKSEREKKVDSLLHDAEHADSGAAMARRMRDFDAAKRLSEKRDALIQKAERLDPQHKCPAWSEHEKWEQYSTLAKDD